MELLGTKLLGTLLIAFCSFYVYEALTKNKIRVKGGRKFFEFKLYTWVEKSKEPFNYWFFTAFYIASIFLGLYILLFIK